MRYAAWLFPLLLAPTLALATQDVGSISRSELKVLIKNKIRSVQQMALNPTLVRAIRRQNAENLTLAIIKKRDKAWSGTRKLTHFKRSLQQNESGRFLQRVVGGNSSFSEAFLTDDKGANVAAYPATSDYWQGDEKKWSESFNNGHGRIFLGPLEKDASSNTYAVQVSAPVFDQGKTIGVLIVGVTLDYLKKRSQAN